MKSLEQLQAERDALDKQIDAARKSQQADAIKQAKQLIANFGLTARDLGLGNEGAKTKKRSHPTAGSSVAIKYRDNQGNTWTGRGKMPRWMDAAIKSGKKKEDYLV